MPVFNSGELLFFAHARHTYALHQAMHAGCFIAKRVDVGVVAAEALAKSLSVVGVYFVYRLNVFAGLVVV